MIFIGRALAVGYALWSWLQLFGCPAASAAPADVADLVTATLRDLARTDFASPYFTDAVVDTVDKKDFAQGTPSYTCWIKNSKGRFGYVAVAGNGGALRVVAVSATTAEPDYFLRRLDLSSLPRESARFSEATLAAFVKGVPLVARVPFSVQGEEKPVLVSELCCCAAGLFEWLQLRQGIPLYAEPHPLFPLFGKVYGEFHGTAASMFAPVSQWTAGQGDSRGSGLQKEVNAALEKGGVKRPSTQQHWDTFVQHRARLGLPIVRRRLLATDDTTERLEALHAEVEFLRNITPWAHVSIGSRYALLLERYYLTGPGIPLQTTNELAHFFRARGVPADVRFVQGTSKLSSLALPAVVLFGDRVAGLLLGSADVGSESYALLYFPSTGRPLSGSLTERLVARFGEKARAPDPPKEMDAEMRKMLERINAANDRIVVNEEMESSRNEWLASGTHMVNQAALSHCQILQIGGLRSAGSTGSPVGQDKAKGQ